jgi:sulfite reductase (ferredoxin)
LADAISNQFSQAGLPDDLSETNIRISGCPNSCGHNYIAEIGLQGKAQRVNGKLMPCYDVLVGANTVEGDAHLGQKVGTVPAKKIPELLTETFQGGEIKKEKLKNLIDQYSDFSSAQFPDDYYYDFGSTEPFSLAGRGPGECGAGVTDVIKLDIDEAKDALKSTPANSENIYKAIVAAARALMVTFGLEPKKDREIFAEFKKGLIEPGWVKPQAQQLLDDAIDWRMGDRESIEDLSSQAEDLTKRVQELYLSLDANLKFKIEPVANKTNIDKDDADNHVIDLRGIACPLNFVKAKLEIEKLSIGEILEVLLDSGEPSRNTPASLTEQGQEVLEVKNVGDYSCVKVRRKK